MAEWIRLYRNKTVELSIGGTDNFMIGEMLVTEFSQSATPHLTTVDGKIIRHQLLILFRKAHSELKHFIWLKDNSGNISSLKQSTVIIDLNRPDSQI